MIDILKYIFLGLVQGITEVLPISSSAHLAITNQLLGISDDSLFLEVLLHVGSLIAIVAFLWKKLVALFKGFFAFIFKKDKECYSKFKYCLMLVVSTLFVVVFTLIFGDLVEKVTGTLYIIGLLLMINGIMLFYLPKISGSRKESDLTYLDAVVIGLFECLGIFPGISRSGSCLCGAFSRKIDKETAADYAFMLFIPAALGALVLELLKVGDMVIASNTIHLYAISVIVSGITTYYSFKLLLSVIRKGKISIFSIYCLIVGLITFIFGIIK